jgi:hypothetical protein
MQKLLTKNSILLTGAGFSKNWGAWLASELWPAIRGHRLAQSNQDLGKIIWKYKDLSFEEIFSDKEIEKHRQDFQQIITDLFGQMNASMINNFEKYDNNNLCPQIQDYHTQREPSILHNNKSSRFFTFLDRFDIFFTLNQDTFFERLLGTCVGSGNNKGITYDYPHLVTEYNVKLTYNIPRVSDNNCYSIKKIPYYKLHGSINFISNDGDDILVMGTSKPEQIEKIPLLEKYHEDFGTKLLSPDTKVMIIGYSFLDHHINKLIFKAVKERDLKFWIIDPSGLEKLIMNCTQAEYIDNKEISGGKPYEEIMGAIVRTHKQADRDNTFKVTKNKYDGLFSKGLISNTKNSLYEIFNNNDLELNRVMDQFV